MTVRKTLAVAVFAFTLLALSWTPAQADYYHGRGYYRPVYRGGYYRPYYYGPRVGVYVAPVPVVVAPAPVYVTPPPPPAVYVQPVPVIRPGY